MNARIAYTAAAFAAALSLAVMPAAAQERQGGNRERARPRAAQGGGSEREARGSRAVPRPPEGRQASAPAQAPQYQTSRNGEGPRRRPLPQAPQYQASRGSDRQQTQAVPQAPQYQASRGSDGQRRQALPQAPQYQASRGSDGQRSQAVPRGSGGYADAGRRAEPRSSGGYQAQASRYDDRRGYPQYGGGYGRYEQRAYVRPPDFRPYRPLYFSRPYYGFRPHVHIGFGVWLGVSVPYPWAYFGSYVPRVYGYSDRGYYGAAAGMQQYGGLSFDIQPGDADLFVDGEYVGLVGTFSPYGEPLTLWPGVHHIAIVRDGFRTMEWDVSVQPGQVIPYRGMLARW